MDEWVLLRGLVREAAHWGDFPERFASALGGARVHLVDVPGNGVHHRARTPLTVDEMAEQVRLEARARAPGAERFFVLAVSLGGMIATAWARRHAGEVAGLVLANSSLGGLSPFWQRLRPSAWPGMLGSSAARSVEAREQRILSLISNRREAHAETARGWAEIQRLRPVSRANALRQMVAAARYRAPAGPPQAPVLVAVGEGDRLVSPACSRAIAAHFGAELVAHPFAGHEITLDAGDWLADVTARWRAGLGAQRV